MAKIKVLDYNYVRLYLLILLLISPLLTKSEKFYEDLNHFDFNLFLTLTTSKPEENIIVSPFALASLLILLRMSSTINVAAEIDKAFNLFDESNAVIIQKFKNVLETYQHIFSITSKLSIIAEKGVIHTMELDANGIIKDWSEYNVCSRSSQLTNPGKITEIELTTEIHFSNFILKYNIDNEIPKELFIVNEYEIIHVDMLEIVAKLKYADIPELRSNIVELPYSDGDTSLVLLIPNDQDGITQLERNLKGFTLVEILSRMTDAFINIKVPKFITTVDFSLKKDFKSLGLGSMFDVLCDFPELIRVSELNYSSSFMLNEKNAGRNPLSGVNLSSIRTFKNVIANHPFIYILKSSKNLIYLIGKFFK